MLFIILFIFWPKASEITGNVDLVFQRTKKEGLGGAIDLPFPFASFCVFCFFFVFLLLFYLCVLLLLLLLLHLLLPLLLFLLLTVLICFLFPIPHLLTYPCVVALHPL